MTFKVLNQTKPIVSTKSLATPNYNIYMEENSMILKKLRDKRPHL